MQPPGGGLRADTEQTAPLAYLLAMWAGFLEQLRRAGWRKVAIVSVAVVVVVVLAYGVNSSDDAAGAHTLPKLHLTLTR
jgi:anti-sigma-K factor RskA